MYGSTGLRYHKNLPAKRRTTAQLFYKLFDLAQVIAVYHSSFLFSDLIVIYQLITASTEKTVSMRTSANKHPVNTQDLSQDIESRAAPNFGLWGIGSTRNPCAPKQRHKDEGEEVRTSLNRLPITKIRLGQAKYISWMK
jgi:hypothetical protein